MDLPPRELRYRKQVFYFIIGMAIFMVCTMILTLSVAPAGPNPWMIYASFAAALLTLAGVAGYFLKRIRSNAPVLTFASHGLIFAKGNMTIPWGEITEWKINRYKSNYRLIVRTARTKRSVDITWLDQDHHTIRSMMDIYIRQPGPNGVIR